MCDLCPLDFLRPYNRLQEIQNIEGKTKEVDVVNQLNCLVKMTRKLRWQMVINTGRFERRWHNAKKGHHVLRDVQVNDICLVASRVKSQNSRFCRLQKMLGGKSVEYSKFNLLPVFLLVVDRNPAAVAQTGGSTGRGKQ